MRKAYASLLLVVLLAGCAFPARCDKLLPMYNYRRAKYEYRCELPADYHEYIPQDVYAQGLYDLLVDDMGYTPVEAAFEVWTAVIGDGPQPGKEGG